MQFGCMLPTRAGQQGRPEQRDEFLTTKGHSMPGSSIASDMVLLLQAQQQAAGS